MDQPRLTIADTTETQRRAREVQLLLNIAQPDPKYQPFFLSDEASLFDAVGIEPAEVERRIEFYFGERLPVSLAVPVYRLVDAIKAIRPGWPDDT